MKESFQRAVGYRLMCAVGYQRSLPIDDPASLVDIEIPKPAPSARDLLVSIKVVSVNPVDAKVRRRAATPKGEWKILGWDAAGVVEAVGPDASLFRPDDAVYYSGTFDRP